MRSKIICSNCKSRKNIVPGVQPTICKVCYGRTMQEQFKKAMKTLQEAGL